MLKLEHFKKICRILLKAIAPKKYWAMQIADRKARLIEAQTDKDVADIKAGKKVTGEWIEPKKPRLCKDCTFFDTRFRYKLFSNIENLALPMCHHVNSIENIHPVHGKIERLWCSEARRRARFVGGIKCQEEGWCGTDAKGFIARSE